MRKKADIIIVHIDSLMTANSGLAVLDPYLRQNGIDCLLINSSEIDEYIDRSEVFALSVYNFSYKTACALSRRLKNKTIIWGGWTATAVPELILRENPDVDYVILREGETRLLNLLRSFSRTEVFDKIDGIAYREPDGTIRVRPPLRYVDLDELPRPNKYALVRDVVFVEIARGCYGGCAYCMEDSRMRFKSAHKAADEIEEWHAQGYSVFHLGNANSVSNGPQLKKLFGELEARKLAVRISLVGRPEDILRNADALEILFTSKLIRPCAVEMGIESNSPRILNLLQRGTSVETNTAALRLLIELRRRYAPEVKILAYIILFSHWDISLDELIENIRFIGDYKCSENVVSPYLIGIRSTAIWDDMERRGFVCSQSGKLQVLRYRFTDPAVESLFQCLIRKPGKDLFYKKGSVSPADNLEFQRRFYDKIIEFYNADDIAESIHSYIESENRSFHV